jgi:uncharacterized membrane protein YcfT
MRSTILVAYQRIVWPNSCTIFHRIRYILWGNCYGKYFEKSVFDDGRGGGISAD